MIVPTPGTESDMDTMCYSREQCHRNRCIGEVAHDAQPTKNGDPHGIPVMYPAARPLREVAV